MRFIKNEWETNTVQHRLQQAGNKKCFKCIYQNYYQWMVADVDRSVGPTMCTVAHCIAPPASLDIRALFVVGNYYWRSNLYSTYSTSTSIFVFAQSYFTNSCHQHMYTHTIHVVSLASVYLRVCGDVRPDDTLTQQTIQNVAHGHSDTHSHTHT